MKNVYKLVAFIIVGFALLFAQGAEAQSKKNKKPRKDDYGQVERFHSNQNGYGQIDRGDHYGHKKYRLRGRYGTHGGYGLGHGRFKHRKSFGRMHVHNGQLFKMNHGVFYTPRYGGWVVTNAPVGLRVMDVPYGARSIQTRRGKLYELKGTFYARAGRGIGFVVTDPPRRRSRGYGRSW